MLHTDASPLSSKSKTHISVSGYVADVLHDSGARPLIWHWIVQQSGDCEILYWGQEHSEADAIQSARDTLDYLSKRSRAS